MGLRKYIDKLKPNFQKDGKFSFLESTFEAFETFLFVPNKTTTKGSHIRDNNDMKRTMITVVIALIPALLFGMWNVGYQYHLSMGQHVGIWQNFWYGFLKVLPIIVVTYVVGLGTEFIFAQIKHHEVNEGFLVTGMLIPMILPVTIPLWMVAIATIFSVIFAKEVFGGTGYNIMNPALVARAFLFFAYPTRMSGSDVWISNFTKNPHLIDGYSGATILGELSQAKTAQDIAAIHTHFPILNQIIGTIPGSIAETSLIAIAIGALILILTGIGSWKTMLAAFVGAAFMGILFNLVGGNNVYMHLPWYEHFFIGGFAFGMVFMLTDPVSSAHTEKGKLIYGFSAGAFAILLRVVNPAYPEGVMLSILMMNLVAPLIDYYVIQAHIKRRLKRAEVTKTKN